MRYAGSGSVDFSAPEELDEILRRQMESSRWEVFDPSLVRQQQDDLIDLMRDRGVDVIMLGAEADSVSQHYPRDLGFVVDDTFFVARLNSRSRAPEAAGLLPLVDRMSNVDYLSSGTIEGGDVMLAEGVVLVGLSEETSPEGVAGLERRLRELESERRVESVTFSRGGVVHLDTLFNVVSDPVALIHLDAFPAHQVSSFARRFDLIPVSADEAREVEVNALSLSPGEVVLDARSERIAVELELRGIRSLMIDFSEVRRVPGSFRCSTLPLVRA